MATDKKIKLSTLSLLVCGILLIVLGYSLWTLSNELEEVKEQIGKEHFPSLNSEIESWPEDWDPWENQWDPSGQFSDLRQRVDEMMNSMMPQNPFFNQHGFGFSSGMPNIEMDESEHAYIITVEVPKGQEVELNTELVDNTLKISGKIKQSREQTKDGISSRQSRASRFSQSIYLSREINESGMMIDNQKTQITITIPKA